jgi:hypothetical protein
MPNARNPDFLQVVIDLQNHTVLPNPQPNRPGPIGLATQWPHIEASVSRCFRQRSQNLPQAIGNGLRQCIQLLLGDWVCQQCIRHASPQRLHRPAVIQKRIDFAEKRALGVRLGFGKRPANELVKGFTRPLGTLEKLLRVLVKLHGGRLYHHSSNGSRYYLGVIAEVGQGPVGSRCLTDARQAAATGGVCMTGL